MRHHDAPARRITRQLRDLSLDVGRHHIRSGVVLTLARSATREVEFSVARVTSLFAQNR